MGNSMDQFKRNGEHEREREDLIDFDRIPREEGCITFFIHFKATFLKRLRVIKRDLKSFIFELILPFAIILLSLFLLRISFVEDFSPRTLNINTYLSDQNPVLVLIGSDSAVFTGNMQTSISTKYGASVDVQADTTNTVVGTFDQQFLYPKKLSTETMKGGIFFSSSTVASGGNTLY